MSTTTQPRDWPAQIRLPGQTAAPEGPVDMFMMYVMHHAFRRDLAKLTEAAQCTPATDRVAWRLLQQRWEVFAEALHGHHIGRGRRPLAAAARARHRGGPGDARGDGGRARGVRPAARGLRAGLRPAGRARRRRRPRGARRPAGRDPRVPGPAPRARGDRRDPDHPAGADPGGLGAPRRGALQGGPHAGQGHPGRPVGGVRRPARGARRRLRQDRVRLQAGLAGHPRRFARREARAFRHVA